MSDIQDYENQLKINAGNEDARTNSILHMLDGTLTSEKTEANRQAWTKLNDANRKNYNNASGAYKAPGADYAAKVMNRETSFLNMLGEDAPTFIQQQSLMNSAMNKEENYQTMKQLRHDIAHFDSAEQGVVDWMHIKAVNIRNSEQVSPEQALKEAREAGVELKFDRPIKRGELDYSIHKALCKKEMEGEMAVYAQTGDYTTLQNILLMGSTISGAVGGWETGIMIGSSFIGGQGVAAGLAKLAQITGRTSSITKGISMAKKVELAEKLARVESVTMNNAQEVAKILESNKAIKDAYATREKANAAARLLRETGKVREASLGEQLTYDAYRAGKAITGEHANIGNVMAYFGTDGLLTDLPVELMKAHDSEITHTGNYGCKEVMAGLLMATAAGAALPAAGNLAKKVPGTLSKLNKLAIDDVTEKVGTKVNEAIDVGHIGAADEAVEKGAQLSDAVQKSFDIAGEHTLTKENQEAITEIASANMDDNEFVIFTSTLVDILNGNKPWSALDALPMRNKWYSNIPGMLDFMQEMAQDGAMTVEHFKARLAENKVPLEIQNGLKDLTGGKEVIARLGKNVTSAGVRIKTEGGALGRAFAKGLTEDDAVKFLNNVYLARMAEGTERGTQAARECEQYITKIEYIKQFLGNIVEEQNRILRANEATRLAGKKPAVPYHKQNTYKLADGSTGRLEDALHDVAFMYMPNEQIEAFTNAQNIIKRYNIESAEKGVSEVTKEEFETATRTINEANAYAQDFVNNLTRVDRDEKGFEYINLDPKIEGSKERTKFLTTMISDLDNMAKDNTDLYLSNDLFKKNIDDPQKIIDMLNGKEDVPELTYSYRNKPVDTLEMHEIIKGDSRFEATATRLDQSKIELAEYEGTKTLESFDRIQKINLENFENGATRDKGIFLESGDIVSACQDLLDGNFKGFRDTFMSKIQNNKFLTKMGEQDLSKLTKDSMLRILRDSGKEVKKALKETFDEVLKDSFPNGAAKKAFKEQFDTIVDDFVEKVKQNPEEALKNFTVTHAVDIEEGITDEAVKQAAEVVEQQRLFGELLQPMFQELGITLMDIQNNALNNQVKSLQIWERCMDKPGAATESVLGTLTGTIINKKGISSNIENLSNYGVEFKRFQQAIDLADPHEKGTESLREFAFNVDNMPSISNAFIDKFALINGLMTDAEKAAYKANSREARAATCMWDAISNMQHKLYTVGSGKKDIAQIYDPSKIRRMHQFLTKDALRSEMANEVYRILENKTKYSSNISDALERFLPRTQHREDVGRANVGMHLLETLDLDKHFGKYNYTNLKLNDVRDALLSKRITGTAFGIDKLIAEHGEAKVALALKTISDSFHGIPQKSIGFLRQLESNTTKASSEVANQSAKYLNDMDHRLYFKDTATMKEQLQYFGFDNMKQMFESNIAPAKRAYAILATTGSEPYKMIQNTINNLKVYASKVAPLELTAKDAEALNKKLSSSRWNTEVRYALNSLTGNYSTAASGLARIANIVARFAAPGMLAKAGIKSLTDYGNQYQYLITSGMVSSTDIGARQRIFGKMGRVFTGDRNIAQKAYFSQQIRNGAINDIFSNAANGQIEKQATGKLSQYASPLDTLDNASNWFADTLLNKVEFIGPLTEYNRSNALFNEAQSLAEFASTRFEDMNPNLQNTLSRYDISAFEWNEIYSKKGIHNMNDYLKKFDPNFKALPEHDFNCFFADTLMDLTDDEVAGFLKAQGKKVNPASIEKYRNNLVDKANMLMETGADEMTTMPNTRIQGWMSFGQDPNSTTGALARIVTQFQSFGAGVTMYQWGRRWASFMDPNDQLFNNILLSTTGFPSAALSMSGLLAEMAIAQYVINDAANYISGTYQNVYDDQGEFLPDVLAEKITKATIDQTGIFGPVLDAVFTGVTKGRGSGGGISLSIAPAPSNAVSQVSRIVNAATRTSTEGQRGKAVTGAILQNIAETSGVAKQPMLQAAWSLIIGDTLTEWQQGTNYQKYLDSRASRGYGPSWLKQTADYFTDR